MKKRVWTNSLQGMAWFREGPGPGPGPGPHSPKTTWSEKSKRIMYYEAIGETQPCCFLPSALLHLIHEEQV